jgi:NhaP-type Na+/H+ or K+/H+ antiporter
MSFSLEKIKPYLLIVLVIGIAIWLRQFGSAFTHGLHEGTEGHVAPYVGALGAIAFSIIAGNVLVRKTVFPQEMLFLIFGIILATYMESVHEAAAGALIYFAGNVLMKTGLGIKISDFVKTLFVTSLLSVVTLLVTAFLFALGQYYIVGWILGMEVPAASAILTGSLLASTDPAALIPVMAGLVWYMPRIRDIVLTESGLTDVTGALLALATFLPMALTGTLVRVLGWEDGFGAVFSVTAVSFLGVQVGWALVGAVAGALVLYILQVLRERKVRGDNASIWDVLKLKSRSEQKNAESVDESFDENSSEILALRQALRENGVPEDATIQYILKLKSEGEPDGAESAEASDDTSYDIWAFVLAFAVAFCLTSWLGGNVFLGCFGAGLVLAAEKHLEHGQHAYDEKIERLFIPPIFVLGGSLVEWGPFWDLWAFGVLSAVLLIVVRYPATFVGLAIPMAFNQVTKEEAKYAASIRQVGAIGIVLAVKIAAEKIPGAELILPTTAWVASATLGFCGPWSTREAIRLRLAAMKQAVAR